MTEQTPGPDAVSACVSCGRTDAEAPLLSFRYRGQAAWICSSCLPVLIHQPDRLGGKLPGSSAIPRAPHGKHR